MADLSGVEFGVIVSGEVDYSEFAFPSAVSFSFAILSSA